VRAGQAESPVPRPLAPAIADPVPVGIAGFAMTTFVLSCVNAGFFGGTAGTPMVLGLAIFYGGLVQLLAGLWAFRRGETFVAVAFCSYGGGFWLSYFFLTYFIAPHLPASVAGNAIGLYLLGWLIFTFYMTIAALRTNLAVLWVFITLTATYLLLVLAEFGVATTTLLPIAGYVGITCGVTAWYVAFAHVTNATFEREMIPTWPLS
jgi:succinate-acetate transporter protein